MTSQHPPFQPPGPSGSTGSAEAAAIAFGEGTAALFRRRGQSVGVALSIALGVGFALAISATGRAVDAKVTGLLSAGPLPPAFDVDSIFRTLSQASRVLTALSFIYTVALVASVTVLTQGEVRREVGTKRFHGVHVWEVMTELLTHALLVSLAGGVGGLLLGVAVCAALNRYFTDLAVRANVQDAIQLFAIGVGLGAISIIGIWTFFIVARAGRPAA